MAAVTEQKVSSLAFAASAVFNGLLRAGVDAGHAVDAVTFPLWYTAFADGDIHSRTNFFTKPALIAVFACGKSLVLDEKAVEQGIDFA